MVLKFMELEYHGKNFENFLWYSSSSKFEVYFFKEFEFLELEFHGKLEFLELEFYGKLKFQKGDRSLYISKTVVNC